MLFPAGVPLVTEEAGAEWGASRATVCRWVRDGHVTPLRRLPGRGGYLFSQDEVERVRRLFGQGLRFGRAPGRKVA